MITEEAKSIVKHYESLHDGDMSKVGLQPKLCPADVWTIGWGHAIIDPLTGKQLKSAATKARAYELFGYVTEQQAEMWLERDLAEFEKAVLKGCTVAPEPQQLGAMVSLAYNIGITNFLKSTLLKRFNERNWGDMGVQFMKWVNSGGKRLDGLVARRASESLYFFTGKVSWFRAEDGRAVEITE